MPRFNKSLLLFVCVMSATCFGQMGDNEGEVQEELPPEVMNMASPVLSPAQALESFVVQEGFHVELVASEPMIQDPVAAVFGPDGSLWVVEMQSFMPDVDGNNELQPISRIVQLKDTNNDGIMDESIVFMEGLVLPRSIALTHEGLLLIAPPNLLYCRDTDGDGKVDDVQTLAGGFGGLDSIEHAGNGLIYGLDNTFHNSQHGFSFKFDGESLTSIPVPAHGQWGTTQDDYGRQYYSPNSYPVLIDDVPKQYARQRGESRTLDGVYRGITTDKRVWPVHPTPGVNRGYQKGRLNEEYKLTRFDAACGPAVYRDTLFGKDFEGDVFVCETVGNLVSRFNIEDNGNGSLSAVPAYSQEEFLASTDERFRPVNLLNGPDGALYIVDMYRGIAQHRMFVTSFLRKQIKARGLESPLGLGRIWRVVPDDSLPNATSDLTVMESEVLVNELIDRNGTIRDMAQRLLVESKDESVVPMLEELAKNANLDRDRIKALWTLQGMGFLKKGLVHASLDDSHPMVRTNAIRLAEFWMNDNDVFNKVKILAEDKNFYVRRQVALSAGLRQGPQAIFFLLGQLGNNDNAKFRSAAIASIMGREHEALDLISLNSVLKKDSVLNRKTLASITKQILSEKSEQANTILLEFATKQAVHHPWQSQVVIDAIISKQKDTQFRLSRKPSRYKGLFTSDSNALYDSSVQLNTLLWWEGREGVQEFIPKRVNRSVAKLITRGKKVYNVCKICHQVDGMGLPPTYPSLVDSPFVLDDETLIKIMLHGLTGPITMHGQLFDDTMPPAPIRNDYDLAAVITYVRQAWGNNSDAITPEDVKAMRKRFSDRTSMWTAEELER